MNRADKAKAEVDLAITALLHESGRFCDFVWTLQLAPPPSHQYHKPEHLTLALESLAKCNTAMKALTRNLGKMVVPA